MNRFEYRIYDIVYENIINNKKNIEYRLLNDKSEKIKPGDEILFKVIDNDNKSILVTVTKKYIYNNIDELWNSKDTSKNTLNYTKEEFTNTLYDIFGKEKVINSKIVGIEFKKI